MGSNPVTDVFPRETHTHMCMCRLEGHVKMKAESGVVLAKVKECMSHQKLAERQGTDSP